VQGVSTITAGQNNPQPLYFGGNPGAFEVWTGRIDDVAIWNNALPTSSVVGLAKGTFTPTNAPLTPTPPPDTARVSLSGLASWTPTNRGPENSGPAGFNAPNGTNGLTLSGTTTNQIWYGTSLESKARFSSSVYTSVMVNRLSLSGSGTGYGSSLWVFGDDGHYLRFAQDVGGGGWVWNARDDGGVGTLNPTGGNNIAELDSQDDYLGAQNLYITIVPTGIPGSVNMFMTYYTTVVAARGFTNFPSTFEIILTGEARATGDSVNAKFGSVEVQYVPEASTATLLLLGGIAAGIRRRRPNTE